MTPFETFSVITLSRKGLKMRAETEKGRRPLVGAWHYWADDPRMKQ
jgi:hypothetical protein